MLKNIIFCIVLFTFGEVRSFHMNVKVKNDKGEIVEEYSEEREVDDHLTEELPYKRVIHAEEQQNSDYIMENGLRFKRSFGKQLTEMSEDDCTESLRQMKRINNGKAVQLVYILQPGDSIKMSCDMCGNEALAVEDITWKKLSREETFSSDNYYITDVKMDMHDDESRNRVYMQNDKRSSLVYKNVTGDDAGTYFCMLSYYLVSKFSGLVRYKMSASLINELFTRRNLFNFYYHLEILPPENAPAILVSKDGKDYPKPMAPYYDDVFIFYTDWGKWSPCSACGEIGERKRHGVCTVKFNPKKRVKYFNPIFVFHILNSVPRGVPCRSTLFENFEFRRSRPDEIMIESCNIPCRGGPGGHFSQVKIGKVKFKSPVPELHITATVGENVEMKCPGATLETIVYWINGTKYVPTLILRKLTSRRADIDVYGILKIKSIELIDAGSYSCWHHDIKKIIYRLQIKPLEDKGSVRRHFGYLCLTFFADFWIFLIMMVIKYKNRRIQVSVYSRAGLKARQETNKLVENMPQNGNAENLVEKTSASLRNVNKQNFGDGISEMSYKGDMIGMENNDVDLPPTENYDFPPTLDNCKVPYLDNYSDRTSFTIHSDRGCLRSYPPSVGSNFSTVCRR